jgi:hypothetical protein
MGPQKLGVDVATRQDVDRRAGFGITAIGDDDGIVQLVVRPTMSATGPCLLGGKKAWLGRTGTRAAE